MIVPPTFSQCARVVATDPGSNCMGVATIDFNCITKEIVATHAFTIKAKQSFINESFDELFGNRLSRIKSMTEVLGNHYCLMRPNFAVCESPFIGMSQPSAYGALMETVCSVRDALASYDAYMPLYMIDPPSAKIGVGAPGNAKKEQMTAAVSALSPILNYTGGVIEALDEHSIDAIAVGYSFLRRLLTYHYS